MSTERDEPRTLKVRNGFRHRRRTPAVLAAIVICACGMPAPADWNVGDGHKMHFPQLPDEDGWDVKSSHLIPAPD